MGWGSFLRHWQEGGDGLWGSSDGMRRYMALRSAHLQRHVCVHRRDAKYGEGVMQGRNTDGVAAGFGMRRLPLLRPISSGTRASKPPRAEAGRQDSTSVAPVEEGSGRDVGVG